MNVAIRVTGEDIADGVRGDCSRCPVAIAAERALHRPVSVTISSLAFEGRDGYREFHLLPVWVTRWIEDFDHDPVEVAPFTFYIHVLI